MRRTDKIKQICNLTIGANRDNPNRNRVYDARGIAPCVVDYSGGVIYNQQFLWYMKRADKIVIAGYVWESRQNGTVLDVSGISPCISVGQHSGVEPKIRVVYEVDQCNIMCESRTFKRIMA